MKIIGIIPARYQSQRLPAKPLANIGGKTMIQRVYEQALQASCLNEVYVATDHPEIESEVLSFKGKVVRTATHHKSGTERCNQAIQLIPNNCHALINIQGDEPFIHPNQINEVANLLQNSQAQIATLIKKITTFNDLINANNPKVVIDKNGKALYFTRQCIPYVQNYPSQQWLHKNTFYKHIGIYGYTINTLQQIVNLPQSPLEKAENLEQLRWLENGYAIQTHITTYDSISVDTNEDLQQAIEFAKQFDTLTKA